MKKHKIVEVETWQVPECDECGFLNCPRCDKLLDRPIHYCEECRMQLLLNQGRKNPDQEDVANMVFRCINKVVKESSEEGEEVLPMSLDIATAPTTAVAPKKTVQMKKEVKPVSILDKQELATIKRRHPDAWRGNPKDRPAFKPPTPKHIISTLSWGPTQHVDDKLSPPNNQSSQSFDFQVTQNTDYSKKMPKVKKKEKPSLKLKKYIADEVESVQVLESRGAFQKRAKSLLPPPPVDNFQIQPSPSKMSDYIKFKTPRARH